MACPSGYRDGPGPKRPETDRRMDAARVGYSPVMSVLLIVLAIIVLLAFGVLGAILEGLLWLTVIAAIIFVVGAVFGYFRFRSSTNT